MIYYGTADGHIKIGYTNKNLWQRTQAHRQKFPDYVVLAAHEGTMSDEARAHRQFLHLKLDGEREWFEPGADLLQHVVNVARGNYLGVVEIESRMQQASIPIAPEGADVDPTYAGIDF